MSLSCRRASELISQSLDVELSKRERLALGFHLVICVYCRRFRRQLRLLRQLIRERFAANDAASDEWRLSDDARTRILSAIGNQP